MGVHLAPGVRSVRIPVKGERAYRPGHPHPAADSFRVSDRYKDSTHD